MIDRNDENDLIPSADELREEVIDKSILDKQTKGWKVIRTQLKLANKSGMHTITLHKRYMERTYCLDIITLYNIFKDKINKVVYMILNICKSPSPCFLPLYPLNSYFSTNTPTARKVGTVLILQNLFNSIIASSRQSTFILE